MDDTKGLVLRRTTKDTSNGFIVRLKEEISRDSDLYELVRGGFEIQVIDIEEDDTETPYATIRIVASEGFDIQRKELIERPNEESSVCIETMKWKERESKERLRELTLEDLERLKTTMRDTIASFERKLNRLKQDRSLAVEKGYHFTKSENHHRWILIAEEMRTVSEQAQDVRMGSSDVNKEIKERRRAKYSRDKSKIDEELLELCRKELGSERFQTLQDKARERLKAA